MIKKIILLVLLILAAKFGYSWWDQHRNDQDWLFFKNAIPSGTLQEIKNSTPDKVQCIKYITNHQGTIWYIMWEKPNDIGFCHLPDINAYSKTPQKEYPCKVYLYPLEADWYIFSVDNSLPGHIFPQEDQKVIYAISAESLPSTMTRN